MSVEIRIPYRGILRGLETDYAVLSQAGEGQLARSL